MLMAILELESLKGAKVVLCRNCNIRKSLVQIVLVLWIIACMYVWFVLDGSPTYTSRHFPSKVRVAIQKTRGYIWPYIWRQYVYADSNDK